MTHSPADVLLQLLIDLGTVSDPTGTGEWRGYVDKEPERPDEVVTIFNTKAFDNGRLMVGEVQGAYGIQVRVRAKTPTVGWAKAHAIQSVLESTIVRNFVVLGAARYSVHCVVKIGRVLTIGKESQTSQRSIYTINCGVQITQCSS